MAAEITGVPSSPGFSPFTHQAEEEPEREGGGLRTLEDQQNWIRGRIEGLLSHEETARQNYVDRWKENQRLLNNEHDFSKKAAWQSKLVVSKVPNAVNAQLSILKGGIVQTKDWFDIDARKGTDRIDQDLLADFKDLLRAELEERDPYTRRDFLDEWLLGLKGGLTNSMLVMKIYPVKDHVPVRVFRLVPAPPQEPEEPPSAEGEGFASDGLDRLSGAAQTAIDSEPGQALSGMAVETKLEMREYVRVAKEMVSTFDYFWDSSGRRKYEFQRIQGDYEDLDRLTSEAGYSKKAIKLVKEKCSAKLSKAETERQERNPTESTNTMSLRRGWDGIEFYGNLQGPDGELIRQNATVTIIEGVVVRDKQNPFDDGAPFRACALEPMPDTTFGRAPIDNVSDIARFITELSNAVVDATTYEVLKMFEVDLEMLDGATDIQTGAFPGKLWWVRDRQGTGNAAIRPIDTGRTPQGAGNMLAYFDRLFQEGTSVTEISQGLQPVRGFPTATEISARQQNTNTSFRAVAQWMEKGSLEPCLEAVFNRMIQFKIFGEGGVAWCKKVLGPDRGEAFYARLYSRVQADGTFEMSVEFRVQALSSILARSSEIERLAKMLDVARQFPGMANRWDMNELSRRVVDVMGYSGEDLMKSDEELAQVDAMEKQAMAGLASSAGQQGASPAGNATAAAGVITPAGA